MKLTPEQLQTMSTAAHLYRVPVAMLFALARVETGFDPDFEAPPPSTAKGMYGLTAELQRFFKVPTSGVWDSHSQIITAAQVLGRFNEFFHGALIPCVAAFYFCKGGLAGEGSALEAGVKRAQAVAFDVSKWPADVRKYGRAVFVARDHYLDQGMPRGETRFKQLANAIAALFTLNESQAGLKDLHLSAQLKLSFDEETPFGWLDELLNSTYAEIWGMYAFQFERAILVDATTAPPWRLEPRLWMDIEASRDLAKFGRVTL